MKSFTKAKAKSFNKAKVFENYPRLLCNNKYSCILSPFANSDEKGFVFPFSAHYKTVA